MTVGAILPPSRPRFESNERLDTVDAQALSDAELLFLDAYSRAITATPAAAGGTVPVGLIIQGFGLTLNPTGPNDNRIRVQSPAGVCFDSNGRVIIKQSGITTDIVLSAGSNQVYAYYIEDQTDVATRRFISVTSPYTESSEAIATTLTADVGYYVQSGDQTSIIASAVVNGVTTALCFLGIANNTGGAVTMPGYNTVTAPNGMYVTNRLASAAVPGTAPTTGMMNGSITSLASMLQTLAYFVGQLAWAGSTKLTPSSSNNYGWAQVPAFSVQGVSESIGSRSRRDPLIGGANFEYGTVQLGNGGGATLQGYTASGANPSGELDLDFPPGFQLTTVALLGGTNGGSAGTWTLTLSQLILTGVTGTMLNTNMTIPVTGSTTAYSFDMAAESTVQSFTAASGGIYTRTVGSFVTDGFFVGQNVTWSGFVNSANNATGTITAVSSTSMTITTTGQITETSATAQVVAVPIIIHAGDTCSLSINSSGITSAGACLSRVQWTLTPA